MIAAVDVMLHISHVIPLKCPPPLLVCICFRVLCFQRLIMDLETGTQLVLRIGEEVVWAVTNEVGAADFGIGDAELRRALIGAAHELFAHELLYSQVSISQTMLTKEPDLPSNLRVSAAAILCKLANLSSVGW